MKALSAIMRLVCNVTAIVCMLAGLASSLSGDYPRAAYFMAAAAVNMLFELRWRE